MKAISIKEPWASMILAGKKTIETRKWPTKYRGKILLCASKSPKSNISGMAFAIADLVNVRPMTRGDEKKACCEIYEGAFSWELDNVKKINPFAVKGQLGLFNINYKGDNMMKQHISKKDLRYLASVAAGKSIKYAIGTRRGMADDVWEEISKLDSDAVRDSEGNPSTLWVTTSLSEEELFNIDGVKDIVVSKSASVESNDMAASGIKFSITYDGNEFATIKADNALTFMEELFKVLSKTNKDIQKMEAFDGESGWRFPLKVSNIIRFFREFKK